jgi:UDP-N-acetylmuramate dehydrogenase
MLVIKENISIKPYNTFAIDVKAKYFAVINAIEDLEAVFSTTLSKAEKLLILGGGSNLLFTNDFDGLVLKLNIKGISVQAEDDYTLVTAGAGEVWHDFVKFCVGEGFAGVENLSLIPGTVGASPIQNIGAYGVELKDVFHSCLAYEISSGTLKTFHFSECNFAYRDSVFKNELKGKYIIVSVTFKLAKEASLKTSYGAIKDELIKREIHLPTIADISDVVSAIRVSKLPDPSTIGNAGSFFKNPIIDATAFAVLQNKFPEVVNYPLASGEIKLAAGWLIEQCGFKGVVEGQTGTWHNQALVIVNRGSATGQEVYNFSEKIIKTVQAKFDVLLEREVNVI